MIEFKNITMTYPNGVNALNDVSFKIDSGEFVFIIGASGAGKSTIIKTILKEVNPTKGKLYLLNEDITKVPARRIPKIRRRIGVVFQDFRLLENKTVYQNVKYVMDILGESKAKVERRVNEVLDLVGLSERKDCYPNQLSGGEQQRVSIARALVNSPKILIADEPTGNLDPQTAKGIMDLLLEINKKGTMVIMVTHARDIVDEMGKRVIHLEHGEVMSDIEDGCYYERD